MPAIDTSSNRNAVPKKVVKRQASASPRPRGMSRTFTPKGKVRPAAPAPVVRKVVLTKTFKTDAGASKGYRQTQRQAQAVENNIAQARKDHARKTSTKTINAEASKKFGVRGQQEAVNKVRTSLAELQASNPTAYQKHLDDAHKNLGDHLKDIANAGQSALNAGAKGVQSAQSFLHEKTTSEGQRHLEKAGLAPDPTVLGKEATELVASAPASIYLAGKAAKEAAGGENPKATLAMLKNFKDTSAVAAAATGHFGEAVKRANERPLTTALELSGAKAVVGRTTGMAARSGVAGKAAKHYASTAREPLRLYKGSAPGEGPAVARRYSKDLLNNRAAKARDRRKARKGIDPNVHNEPTVQNLSGGRSRVKPPIGPGKHPLEDRVDRHVHAQHVVQSQAKVAAERASRKRGHAAEPMVDKAAAYAAAKEHTLRNPRVNGLDPKAIAHQAHDVLKIEKPVIVRLMTAPRVAALTARLGKEPRAYTEVKGDHYRIEINPNHPLNKGPKGLSNVAHYELGRVQGEERGLVGPGEVGSHKKAYFDNPNTKHAQQVLRTHIATDLRKAPPELPPPAFTGSVRPSRRDEAGQRAAQAVQQAAAVKAVKEFAIHPNGYKPSKTHQEAMIAKAAHEARLGEKLVPVNAARLTRMPKEPVVAASADKYGLRLATAQERAWKSAVEDHRDGKWVLMPERVVKRFIQHAENSRNYGPLQRSTNLFKDVVLTTSNPIRWLGGNVTDLGMRSVFEGLTPPDLYRGAKVYRELGRRGERGKLVQASTTGGGFGHLARDVTGEVAAPGVGHLAKAWGHYRSAVYGIESAIESLPQMATVGKEARQGVPISTKAGLKGLLRATDEQIQHFATKMVTDPAVEMQIAKHVEDVIGKWGKLSPEARKALAFAPFAQWLGAATKYVMVTLPAKHPIKAGIIAAVEQMTEPERQALGLSQFLPLEKQAQDYQMMALPQHVGKDKYGPVVKGTDLARALSMGTVKDALDLNVGGYLFPQFSGAFDAAKGTSWTGEPLKYPEGKPHAGMQLSSEDKRATAIGMLIEGMVPFGSSFRRIFQEKGRPSLPQSNLLNPQVRSKFDPKTKTLVEPQGSLVQGLERFAGWPIPGLPMPKRVYTKGAINQMERSRTAIQEVKGWNAKRAAEAAKNRDPEIGAFGKSQPRKTTDQEATNLGGTQPRKGKNIDPEVEAFK